MEKAINNRKGTPMETSESKSINSHETKHFLSQSQSQSSTLTKLPEQLPSSRDNSKCCSKCGVSTPNTTTTINTPVITKRRSKDWALEHILTNEIDDMSRGLNIIAERRRPVQLSIISILQGVVSSLWPASTLEPYGSFSTGLSSASSDVDLLVRNWCDIDAVLRLQQQQEQQRQQLYGSNQGAYYPTTTTTNLSSTSPTTTLPTTTSGAVNYPTSSSTAAATTASTTNHTNMNNTNIKSNTTNSSPSEFNSNTTSTTTTTTSSTSSSSSTLSPTEYIDHQRTNKYKEIEQAFLVQLYQVLGQQRWVETVQIYQHTKVPVIKIKTAAVPIPFMDQGYKPIVWIDITLERPSSVRLPRTRPVRTAEFVRRLLRGFPAIKPLALVLKQLLVERGLNESYTGGLCSYGLVLMITHVIRRDVIKKAEKKQARLNKRKENGNENENEKKGKDIQNGVDGDDDDDDEEERPPLGRLLLNFFDYYGKVFNSQVEGISLERDSGTFPRAQAFCSGSLVVQDPLALTNNVTGGCYGWNTLRTTFLAAETSMRSAYTTVSNTVIQSIQKETHKNKHQNEEANKRSSNESDDNESDTTESNDANDCVNVDERDTSVLGHMFGTAHHSHVIDHASKLWCPSEIPIPVTRRGSDSEWSDTGSATSGGTAITSSSIAATSSNATIGHGSVGDAMQLATRLEHISSLNASLSIENEYLRLQVEKLSMCQHKTEGEGEGEATKE